jgi:hypothetical protein
MARAVKRRGVGVDLVHTSTAFRAWLIHVYGDWKNYCHQAKLSRSTVFY